MTRQLDWWSVLFGMALGALVSFGVAAASATQAKPTKPTYDIPLVQVVPAGAADDRGELRLLQANVEGYLKAVCGRMVDGQWVALP